MGKSTSPTAFVMSILLTANQLFDRIPQPMFRTLNSLFKHSGGFSRAIYIFFLYYLELGQHGNHVHLMFIAMRHILYYTQLDSWVFPYQTYSYMGPIGWVSPCFFRCDLSLRFQNHCYRNFMEIDTPYTSSFT